MVEPPELARCVSARCSPRGRRRSRRSACRAGRRRAPLSKPELGRTLRTQAKALGEKGVEQLRRAPGVVARRRAVRGAAAARSIAPAAADAQQEGAAVEHRGPLDVGASVIGPLRGTRRTRLGDGHAGARQHPWRCERACRASRSNVDAGVRQHDGETDRSFLHPHVLLLFSVASRRLVLGLKFNESPSNAQHS